VLVHQWAYFAKVQLDFSRPGRPSDNAVCEPFNNFYSIEQLRIEAAVWRVDYNAFHPHSSLGNLAPEEFARQARNAKRDAVISGEATV
jgi:putative transposase